MIQRIVEEKRIFITLWTTYIYIYIYSSVITYFCQMK